jgi:hypothetical protein
MPRHHRDSWLFRLSAAGCGLAFALLALPARADSVVVTARQDATLFENGQGAFASGSGPAIFAGRINTAQQSLRRALVLFDVAASVPPGSSIDAVRLRLHLAQSNPGSTLMRLYRVTQSWGEGASSSLGGGGAASQAGDATWVHRFYDGDFWTHPGGDFDPIPRAETNVDQPAFYTWESTPEMVADVQSWLEEAAANFGWVLVGDEARVQTAKRFDSSEIDDPLLQPVLEIVYTPPCVPRPEGPGFWRQACAAGLDDAIRDCAAGRLEDIGLPGLDACDTVLALPPPACEARAERKLAVLVLNFCSNRLQSSCPVRAGLCDSSNAGDLLSELGFLLASGDCRTAAACAGLPE